MRADGQELERGDGMSMLDEVFVRDFFGMKQRDAMQAEQDRQNGIKREPPLTEQRVREIIRDELARRP